MSALTIPAEAMPIVTILRRDVPRPTELPAFHKCPSGVRRLRWAPRRDRKFNEVTGCCPMGLHHDAGADAPGSVEKWGLRASRAFGAWWDSLTEEQAAEAMDLIWPVEVPR